MKGARGVTLIELVVAMAIFALVAVMGVQALNGTLRQRDRLTEIDAEGRDLSFALSLLRQDIGALVPMMFHPPEGGLRSAVDQSADGLELALSIGGQLDLRPELGLGLHRVAWRLDHATQTLTRSAWPTLVPANAAQQSPDVQVLDQVTGIEVRSYWPQQGWVTGTFSGTLREASLSGGGDEDAALSEVVEVYSDTLPLGLEVTLELATGGRIVLVESLK